ncbi:MAG: hypothetical protein PVF73_13210, partial [Bacteroidales bacterium]
MTGAKVKEKIRDAILLFVLMAFIITGALFSVRRIHFEESISSVMPVEKTNKLLVEVLDSAKFLDRIVFHIFNSDTSRPDPDILVSAANSLTDSIRDQFMPRFIVKIDGKQRLSLQDELFGVFYNNLPLYLSEKDYQRLDSLIRSDNMDQVLKEHLKLLNSPAGSMVSRYLFKDPFGLASGQFDRLKALQLDNNLTLYRNYLVTRDKSGLLFFVTPSDAGNTGENALFIDRLDKIISTLESQYDHNIGINYVGSLPVATANAQQIKKDVRLTVTIAL